MKALAIDLGGSHVSCAAIEETSILKLETLPWDARKGLRKLLPSLEQALERLLVVLGGSAGGIGMAFCGIVDAAHGRVLATNGKYDDAPDIDLTGWAGSRFGIPLRLENDARLALLGEWCAGAAKGFQDVVMITLGTGIGGAAMIAGRLLRGKHFQAGCLGGHFPITLQGRRCECGNVGCAESEASTWSLPEICRERPDFTSSALSRASRLDFKTLFECAGAGDACAAAVRDHCLAVWSMLSVGLVHAYDPDLILLGGGAMESAETILPVVRRHVQEHAWTPWGKVQVQAAALGSNAGLLGVIPLLREDRS